MERIECPECGSADVMFSSRKQRYVCVDCSKEFEAGKKINPRRIFLSYGHDENSDLALRLKTDLEAAGHSVWIDSDSIRGGSDWEDAIEKGLRWASEIPRQGRFILLMTPHAVRRPDGFCLNELSRALSLALPVMPAMVSWCEPPLSICRLQWIDLLDCVPLISREEKYRAKLSMLLDVLDQEQVELKGAQSRLLHVLQPLPFDADLARHLARFTGRRWVIDRIDAWLADTDASRIFWIVGRPGFGKTALSSWLCFNRREVAAFHLCSYGHVQKSDARRCVLSIAYQLSTQIPEYRERLENMRLEGVIDESNARTLWDYLIVQPLSGDFPPLQRRLLVVIDALDEASQGDRNELAEFIASEFTRTPDWLRLVITSRPDPKIMHLLQGLTPHVLDQGTSDNISDIRDFLKKELKPYYGDRDVPAAALDTIIGKSEGVFLYAEWIRQELAMGRLSLDRLEEFPGGLGGVYALFFRRQFRDIETYRSMVRPALEVIAAASEDLTVNFISNILKWNEYRQNDVIETLGSLFPVSGDVIKPFHRSLIEWLTDKGRAGPYYVSALQGHRLLADYGLAEYRRSTVSWARYLLTYLAVNLCMSGRWDELKDVLTNEKFLGAAWHRDRFNLMKQWTFIEENSPLRMEEAYSEAIRKPETRDVEDLIVITDLLRGTYHLDPALKLYDHLVKFYRGRGDLKGLERSLGNMAFILKTKSDFDGAMALLVEQETACKALGDKDALAIALCRQAEILYHRGEFDRAMDILKEQEKYCRELDNKEGLSTSYNIQVDILDRKGETDEALRLCREQERLCRELGNKEGLQLSLNNQAVMLYRKGDMDSASALWKEQEKICRETRNLQGQAEAMGGQGIIALIKGDHGRALALLREQERICRELGNKFSLQIALGNQSIILRMLGDLDGAMALHVEEERICRELGEKYGLQASLANQALLHRWRGELDESMALFKEQELISRENGYRDGVASSLDNQGVILRLSGDLDGAMRFHEEAERIGRELGDKYRIAISLVNQAVVLRMKGHLDEAMTLLEEQAGICKDIDYSEGLVSSLGEQAIIKRAMGDPDGALSLHSEEEKLYRQQKNLYGLQTSLRNQALCLRLKGNGEAALKLFMEHLKICRDLGVKDYGRAFGQDEEAAALAAEATLALELPR
jgi:tetratricopeptide (TPR) repeat protein